MVYKKIILLFMTLSLFICCAGSSNKKILLQSNKIRPHWCDSIFQEDRLNYYFTCKVITVNNPSDGFKKAKLKLIENIKIRINMILQYYYSDMLPETDDVDLLKIFVSKVFELMDLDNIIPDDTYYEKVQEKNSLFYNCYIYKIITKQILLNKVDESSKALQTIYKNKKVIINKFQNIHSDVIK